MAASITEDHLGLPEELRVHALQVGVRHFVYKTNTIDELCQVIQRLLATAGA